MCIEDIIESVVDEFKGYCRYKKLGEESDNEEIKQKYMELAEQEKSHFTYWHDMLKKQL